MSSKSDRLTRKPRREAIQEHRALIDIRHKDTGEKSTAAVCPGCWHTFARRRELCHKLDANGWEVVSKHDRPCGGKFDNLQQHAPGCPYA